MSYIIFIILFDLNEIFFYNNDVLIKPSLINIEKMDDICIESMVKNKNQNFLFDPFIKMFDKSGSFGFYYPSYFLPSNLNVEVEDLNLLEYIIYNQYEILAHYTQIFSEYSLKINSILN
jgi:hypothetical protein